MRLLGRAARALALLALVVAAGCAAPSPAPSQPATRQPSPTAGAGSTGVVRMAWADVGLPTPFRVSTAGPGGAVMISLLYDTLTWKDGSGIIPWLATRWTVSPDGRDYTFTLAPNVRWQDGQPLTAADVAFSFTYYASHPYQWMSTQVVESATALAPDTVRLRLRQPYAPFLEDIAGVVPIIPEHVWSKVGDPAHYGGPDATLGSGPYRLAQYQAAQGSYRLVANPSYFKGAPRVGEIDQLNVPAQTQLPMLEQGKLDLFQTTDASVAQALAGHPRDQVLATAPLSMVRLAVNTSVPPLNDVRVRQALLDAMDRASIARAVTKGPPVVGSAGVIPPESPWFNPSVRSYPYDPAKARALLGGRKLTLELLADPTYREPELLRPMLQAVGVTLQVKVVDGPTKAQLLREHHFQLAEVQHIGIGGDPDYLRQWVTGEEANQSAQGFVFDDPTYTDLAKRQAATLDVNARKALVNQLQDVLAEQLPTLPLYYRRFYWVYDRTTYTPMNTWGGLMNGIPFVQNKLTFLRP